MSAPTEAIASPSVASPTSSVLKRFDLFPNTKPANGKYMGVISGLLRNLPPRDVLSSASPFNLAGAVHDAVQDAKVAATDAPASPPSPKPLDLLLGLCEDAKQVFDNESVIVNVTVGPKDRLVLVGDIHGQFRDLQTHVLSHQRDTIDIDAAASEGENVDCKYLFLGDYVDRGPQGVEVITLLLALKVEYPNNVFMIRGNHEDAQVSRLYGFLTECKNKLEPSSWGMFSEVFCNIPLGATVECETGSFFCCHGGLSPNVDSIEALQFLNRADYGHSLGEDGGEAIDGLLWSDPGEHKGFRRNMRGCGYTFGSDTTSKFCELNRVSFVCRAHQMVMAGYQWEHDQKLLTLFSAPNYCGINHNKGAIAIVLGSAADAKYKAAVTAKAAEGDDADQIKPVEEAGECSTSEVAPSAIPIVFRAFTSAPSEPCTLYYSVDPTVIVKADANGSPIMASLDGPNFDNATDDVSAATPRPAADPNLAIDGLQYFGKEDENKK
eukprot:GILI01008047.1.p1 GENE.GILI01008047.1~~GILI01008047.1.p1  ORF type:complete len:494 (-),score=129.59 GILI01008047.1:556-2037(-)